MYIPYFGKDIRLPQEEAEFIKGIDFEAAERFLSHFGEVHTYQTFQDNKALNKEPANAILHGSFKSVALQLARLNYQKEGIFFMVNEGDLKGRTNKNVTRVRAVFADLDEVPLAPVLECGLLPHLVVHSSPGRHHCYWLTDEVPLEEFKGIQKAIARKFGSDKSVNDLSRVLRIPGFYHQKKEEPFQVKVIHEHL